MTPMQKLQYVMLPIYLMSVMGAYFERRRVCREVGKAHIMDVILVLCPIFNTLAFFTEIVYWLGRIKFNFASRFFGIKPPSGGEVPKPEREQKHIDFGSDNDIIVAYRFGYSKSSQPDLYISEPALLVTLAYQKGYENKCRDMRLWRYETNLTDEEILDLVKETFNSLKIGINETPHNP